jgi:hypothetical protein
MNYEIHLNFFIISIDWFPQQSLGGFFFPSPITNQPTNQPTSLTQMDENNDST